MKRLRIFLLIFFLPAALLSVWMMLRRRAAYWPAVVLFGTCILQSHVLTSLLLVGASVIMLLVSLTRLRMPDRSSNSLLLLSSSIL